MNTHDEIFSTMNSLNDMMNALVKAIKETVDESTEIIIFKRAWEILQKEK